jgi:hypothetical protein
MSRADALRDKILHLVDGHGQESLVAEGAA